MSQRIKRKKKRQEWRQARKERRATRSKYAKKRFQLDYGRDPRREAVSEAMADKAHK